MRQLKTFLQANEALEADLRKQLARVAALERRKQEQEAEQQTIEAYYQARLEEMQGQYDRLLNEIDDAKRDAQVKVYKQFEDDAPVLGGPSGPRPRAVVGRRHRQPEAAVRQRGEETHVGVRLRLYLRAMRETWRVLGSSSSGRATSAAHVSLARSYPGTKRGWRSCPAEDDAAKGTLQGTRTVHFSDARRSPLAKRHRPV